MKRGGSGKNFIVQIEGELKNEKDGKKKKEYEWEIIDLNNGRYEVKMKMKHEGKHSISIKYDGFDIFDSPFQIQVFPKFKTRNYKEINQPKLVFGLQESEVQIVNSNGVTIDSNGNILVCDPSNHKILKFNSEGGFISTFGSKGNGSGQFNVPYGITVNSKGNIIVSDNGNHRIQIFDSEGKFVSTFGSKGNGNGNGQFNYLKGICVDLNDNILVCDQSQNSIQIFNSNGEYISQFEFYHPSCITIDSKSQNIIVCGESGNYIF